MSTMAFINVSKIYACLYLIPLSGVMYNNIDIVRCKCSEVVLRHGNLPKYVFIAEEFVFRQGLTLYYSEYTLEFEIDDADIGRGIAIKSGSHREWKSPIIKPGESSYFWVTFSRTEKKLKLVPPRDVRQFLSPDLSALVHPLLNTMELRDDSGQVYPNREKTEELIRAINSHVSYCANNLKGERRQHIENCLKSQNPHIKKWARWLKERENYLDTHGK